MNFIVFLDDWDRHPSSCEHIFRQLLKEKHQVIEGVFGEIVFDRYGCEELSIIASECDKHDGLHINDEGLYVEVIGEDNTTPGDLIITDLTNRVCHSFAMR